MTEQEIFDTVLTHLREQGKAAATDDGAWSFDLPALSGPCLSEWRLFSLTTSPFSLSMPANAAMRRAVPPGRAAS